MKLAGQTALVTGSSSGIGAAIAMELASNGAHVAVHYRGNEAGALSVVEAIRASGGECSIFQADVIPILVLVSGWEMLEELQGSQ